MRYVILLERALAAYWTRAGWTYDPAQPRFAEVFFVVREFTITYHVPISRTGTVQVQLWLDHLGTTSAVYGFRVLSDDGTVAHAEERRAQVRLDASPVQEGGAGTGGQGLGVLGAGHRLDDRQQGSELLAGGGAAALWANQCCVGVAAGFYFRHAASGSGRDGLARRLHHDDRLGARAPGHVPGPGRFWSCAGRRGAGAG
jgi:acyl-CoA thioester hydrolase